MTFKPFPHSSLIPTIDDGYSLGSPSLRWKDGYFANNSLHIVSTSAETGTAADWNLSVIQGGHLSFNSTNNRYLTITDTGYVGIGTSAPQGALHVEYEPGVRLNVGEYLSERGFHIINSTATPSYFGIDSTDTGAQGVGIWMQNTNGTNLGYSGLQMNADNATMYLNAPGLPETQFLLNSDGLTVVSQSGEYGANTYAEKNTIRIQWQQMNFAGASTVDDAATLNIQGAPVPGNNATLTNTYALWSQQGNIRFDDAPSSRTVRIGDNTVYPGDNGILLTTDATSTPLWFDMISTDSGGGNPVVTYLESTLSGDTSWAELRVEPGVWSRLQLSAGGTSAQLNLSSEPGGDAAYITSPYRIEIGARSYTFANTATTISNPISHGLLFQAGAHTGLTANTEFIDFNLGLARTVTFQDGSITEQRAVSIGAPTYDFDSSGTITTASTVSIEGAPVAGANATITDTYALLTKSGTSLFTYASGKDIRIGAGIGNFLGEHGIFVDSSVASDIYLGLTSSSTTTQTVGFYAENIDGSSNVGSASLSVGAGAATLNLTGNGGSLFEISASATEFIISAAGANDLAINITSGQSLRPYADDASNFGTAAYRWNQAHVRALFAEVAVNPQTAANVSPAVTDSRTAYTNEGATAEVNFNLPTAVAGLQYTFIVQDTDGIQITANTGDTIRVAGSVSASGGTAESTTIGNILTLLAINDTEWFATSVVGTWTLT